MLRQRNLFLTCVAVFLALACLGTSALFAQQMNQANPGETTNDAAIPQNPAMKQVEGDPNLPNVLLIGDSISISYTVDVQKLLAGKANVFRIPANAGGSGSARPNFDKWLGDKKWDVIHFNYGIWDAMYNQKTGQPTSTPEAYEKNLAWAATRLKATGAKVIFATTTPIPARLLSKFADIPKRNEIAVKVMNDNGVAIDDLYTAILPRQVELQPKDVHFNPVGAELLAESVAASIELQLPKK